MRATRITTMAAAVAACALTLGAAAAGEGKGDNLASLFPAETMMYYEMPDMAAYDKAAENTALGKVANEKDVRRFGARLRKSFYEFLEKHAGVPAEVVSALEGLKLKRWAAGVAIENDGEDDPHSIGLIVAEVRDPDQCLPAIQALPSLLQKENPAIKMESVDAGRGGLVFATDIDDKAAISFGICEGKLFVTVNNLEIWSLTDLRKRVEKRGSLSDTPALQKARLSVGGEAGVFAFVRVGIWNSIIQERLKNCPSAFPGNTEKNLAIAQSIGLWDIERITIGITADGDGYRNRFAALMPEGRVGFFSLFESAPLSKSLLNIMPVETRSAMGLRFDPSRFMDWVREMTVAGGGDPQVVNMGLVAAASMTTVHPENDFLKHLGSEMAFFDLDPDTVGGVPLLGLNAGCAAIEVKDRAKVEDAMSKMASRVAGLINETQVPADFRKIKIAGHESYMLTTLFSVVSPCFAVTDDHLILTMSPHAMERVLLTLDGKHERLIDNAEFVAAMKTVGGFRQSGVFYSTRPHLSFSGGYKGLYQMSFMAGLLLPALSRARGAARKVQDMNNLKQVGVAIMMYMNDYNRKPPASLAALVEDQYIADPKVFVNPQSQTGYHLLTGWQQADGADLIIVWDAAGSIPEGRNALHMDGHVKFYREDEFQARLEETLARLRQKGRQPKVLDPWTPPGMGTASPASPATAMGDGFFPKDDSPEEVMRFIKILTDMVPLNMLPAADSFNRHMFAPAAVLRTEKDGIYFDAHSPLPLVNPFGMGEGGSGGGLTTVSTVAIIAAIAVPNLLESRMQANEVNAIAALRSYASAQATYKKARYGGGQYAESLAALGEKQLLPTAMIRAEAGRSDATPHQGYYFMTLKKRVDEKIDYQNDFALVAFPAAYGKSGATSYIIDATGQIWCCDLMGDAIDAYPSAQEIEEAWWMP